ncbi:intestinal mucin-like protein [Enoplosus armatus]|uniref:intestinal mucin-like protein n=1 Tax=Enoplosus armatus TaxID=215367 RepID=UPI0039930150
MCYGWGDPHYVTFDGTYYGYQGSCSSWLVKEISPKYNFGVIIDNEYCGAEDGLSCPQSITVFYKSYKIFITQKDVNEIYTNLISVNDKNVSPAYQNGDFRITTTGIDTVLVIPKIHAKITFTGLIFSINLPYNEFANNTQGQCVPILTINPVFHSVFAACHSKVDYSPFVLACEFDVCHMHLTHIGCTSLQTYAEVCAEAGVCIDWRNATKGVCEYKCPSPKVYRACGPLVAPTCDSWYNQKFIYTVNEFSAMTDVKLEGCYCPDDTILLSSSSNECVPSCECDVKQCHGDAPHCPVGTTLNTTLEGCCLKYHCNNKSVCVFNNHEYQIGEPVPMKKCDSCSCNSQCNIDCLLTPCDTHCPVPGTIWTPAWNLCVKFECVKDANHFITVEAKTICPPYDPSDCIPGTEAMAPDGCCHICVPKSRPCGMTTTSVHLESKGCHSPELVNVTSCSGACGTFTFYSSKMRSLQHTCSCCQELATSERQIQLSCPDSTEITYSYTHIDACGCLDTECSVVGRSEKAAAHSRAKTRRRRR